MAKAVRKSKTAKPQSACVFDSDYLPFLLALLKKARTNIDILAFSFAIGSMNGKINTESAPYKIAKTLKEIKEKHGDEIRIRLYIEGLRETADRNSITAKYLEDAGVEVVYGATHAKGFCIDERFVLFGSTNLSNQSITKNKEANLFFNDPKMAKGFMQYFEHLWNGGGHGEITLEEPYYADGDFKELLIDMCGRAKKRIEFAIYFFDHLEIEQAIVKAHKRGVKVTGFVHQHRSFAMSYIRRNKSTVKRMRAKGLDDIHFSIPNTFSHSKYLVIDRKELALGTGNWLIEDVEIHPQLYIHLQDATLAKELVAHLADQIKTHSTDD
jgi:phosphatidylserine/phosphatidylglycerophosphate/cardiolipin synthase-like enzyme